MIHGPQILNSGKAVLFTLSAGTTSAAWDAAQIVVQRLPAGERKVIVRGGSDARYLPSGHLIYALSGNILAVPFDTETLETRGSASVVLEGVMRPAAFVSGAAALALSANGMLAYVPGDAGNSASPTVLAFVDRSGKTQPLPLPPEPYSFPRLSPDGKQIAFQRNDKEGAGPGDIWVYELSGGRAARKLTFDNISGIPVWSPDGRRVIFLSGNSLFWKLADGSGPVEPLSKPDQGFVYLPESVDAAGKVLAVTRLRGSFGGLALLSLEGDRKIQPFVEVAQSIQIHASFSPNGRCQAYMSTEWNGFPQIFVQHSMTSAKYQITTSGGDYPLWSADGRQLFYEFFGKLFAVEVLTEPAFSAGPPSELPITGTLHPTPGMRNYDVTKDGRFLVVLPPPSNNVTQRPTARINVVVNWLEELKQRVPLQ